MRHNDQGTGKCRKITYGDVMYGDVRYGDVTYGVASSLYHNFAGVLVIRVVFLAKPELSDDLKTTSSILPRSLRGNTIFFLSFSPIVLVMFCFPFDLLI
jgi:hypothetical protein